MSRAQTTLNALLAAMFLVSMLPAGQAASDPATNAQEAAIQGQLDNVGSKGQDKIQADWEMRNELQHLYMRVNETTKVATGVGDLLYKRGSTAATDAQTHPLCAPGPSATGTCTTKIFNLGRTASQSELSALQAHLWLSATTGSQVTVDYQVNGTRVVRMTINIPGVVINAPPTATEYTVSQVLQTPLIIQPNSLISVQINGSTTNQLAPANTLTLYYGSQANPSHVVQTVDAARIAAWTENTAVPALAASTFPIPASSSAAERTMVFRLAQVNSMGDKAVNNITAAFKIVDQTGVINFDSSNPAGSNAAGGQRWGSGATTTDTVTVPGVRFTSHSVTFPETLKPGTYRFLVEPACASSVTPCPTWTVEVPVVIGSDKGTLTLAAGEVSAKTILLGQRTSFRIALHNQGVTTETFALQAQAGGVPPGWNAAVAPAQVSLGPGGETEVELTVTPPANGANGQANDIQVVATALSSGRTFDLDNPVRVTLTNVRTVGVEIVNSTANEAAILVNIGPGATRAIPVLVENKGNGFDRFVVSLTGAPAGFTASASPALLELDAKSQGATLLNVEAPNNAVGGTQFTLVMKASRLDDLGVSDTQAFTVKVVVIDRFTFGAFNSTAQDSSPVFLTGTPAKPVLHWLRDEGPDATPATTGVGSWNGDADPDRDYDQSALFRLVLSNEGDFSDIYTLTPFVLTSGDSQAATLAGGAAGRDALGYQDLAGCDGSTTADGKNDGWLFRMFEPKDREAASAKFSDAPQDFTTTKRVWQENITVAPKTSKVVYVEMKWIVPSPVAASACEGASNRAQGSDTAANGARAADPAPGHAVLIEAVSKNDPSHRATQALNTRIVGASATAAGTPPTRQGSQTYSHQVNRVYLHADNNLVSKVVSTDAGGRSARYDLRAVNGANEMDTLRITIPQFTCASGVTDSSRCWEHGFEALDKNGVFTNTAGKPLGGTCTNPAVANPSSPLSSRIVAFECTMGAYDEVAFKAFSIAPAAGAIGDVDNIRVTATSKDSFSAATAVFDDVAVITRITGTYALDLVTPAAAVPAPIHPGETTAIPVTLRNLGTNDDNVTVDLRDLLANGWTGDFSVPNPVFVPAGRQVDLLLFAHAPAAAATGAVQKLEVRATSLDSPAIAPPVDNVTVRAIVQANPTQLSVSGVPQNVVADPGEEITLTARATRDSGAAKKVNFTLDPTSVPTDWVVTQALTNPAGGHAYATTGGVTSKDVTFKVRAPAGALGTSRGALRVVANDGVASDFTHLGVSLSTPNLGVDLEAPEGLQVYVAPGEASKVRLTVENLGVGQDVIRLTAGALPPGWNAVFDAGNVTLQPLQKRSVNVTVTAPSALAAGQSRLLTFIATTSDGVRTDTVQVNFTTGHSILGVAAQVTGVLRQLPQEAFTFTVSVNNTGDLPDAIEMRSGLTGAFKDVVKMAFEPATLDLEPGHGADVLVTVTFPAGLAPNLDVPLVIEAASAGPFLHSVGAVTVATKVLDHKVRDVDGDLTQEYAVDRDLDSANGYEQFRDPNVGTGASKAVDAGSMLSAAAKSRFTVTTTVNGTTNQTVRYTFDPDGDKKTDLLVDRDADGKPDVYWDPDRGYSHVIPVLKDVTKDGREDYFFDLDGEGGLHLDVYYDPIEGRTGRLLQIDIDNNGVLDYVVDANGNNQPDLSETVLFGGPEGTIASIRETADVDGDGKLDSVIDEDGDGKPDYFVPNGKSAGVPIVLEDVDGDGVDDWTYDTDGDGRRDAYYNPVTKKSGLIDTRGDFFEELGKYWYIGALFGVVLVLFVVLLMVTRR